MNYKYNIDNIILDKYNKVLYKIYNTPDNSIFRGMYLLVELNNTTNKPIYVRYDKLENTKLYSVFDGNDFVIRTLYGN